MLKTTSISIILSGIGPGISLRPSREEENIPSNEDYDPNSEILFAYSQYLIPPYIHLCEKGKNCETPLKKILFVRPVCTLSVIVSLSRL